MNNPDHISESLETIFWVKILKFFDADPGFEKEEIRIRDGKKFGSRIRKKHTGSATLLRERFHIALSSTRYNLKKLGKFTSKLLNYDPES
jgi:hypothetical protein